MPTEAGQRINAIFDELFTKVALSPNDSVTEQVRDHVYRFLNYTVDLARLEPWVRELIFLLYMKKRDPHEVSDIRLLVLGMAMSHVNFWREERGLPEFILVPADS
jgi:hypothetical protein